MVHPLPASKTLSVGLPKPRHSHNKSSSRRLWTLQYNPVSKIWGGFAFQVGVFLSVLFTSRMCCEQSHQTSHKKLFCFLHNALPTQKSLIVFVCLLLLVVFRQAHHKTVDCMLICLFMCWSLQNIYIHYSSKNVSAVQLIKV